MIASLQSGIGVVALGAGARSYVKSLSYCRSFIVATIVSD